MKWPELVPDAVCKTPITVHFETEELNKYGGPLEVQDYTGKCNFQDKAKTVYTAEKKLVEVTGTALFNGDICPELPVISSGTAKVFGKDRTIAGGCKARNPDGTVNYTEVWVR